MLCNGIVECPDASDEFTCQYVGGGGSRNALPFSGGDVGEPCMSGEERCDLNDVESPCMEMYKFCDRKFDCPNGEDEVIERCVSMSQFIHAVDSAKN